MSLFFSFENVEQKSEFDVMEIRKNYMLLYEITLRRDRDDQRNQICDT